MKEALKRFLNLSFKLSSTWQEIIVTDADTETCGPSKQATELETVKEESEIECEASDNEDHKPADTLKI